MQNDLSFSSLSGRSFILLLLCRTFGANWDATRRARLPVVHPPFLRNVKKATTTRHFAYTLLCISCESTPMRRFILMQCHQCHTLVLYENCNSISIFQGISMYQFDSFRLQIRVRSLYEGGLQQLWMSNCSHETAIHYQKLLNLQFPLLSAS